LHFADNQNPPTQDREEPDYDYGKSDKYFRLYNLKNSEIYRPTEHIAVDEVITQFTGNIIFRQYIPERNRDIWYKNL
jgi:hypothetical protein